MSLEIVILAAGQGTRMRSALPKVLHPIAGKPMLGHVIDCARQLQPERIHVVIGHGADLVRERMAADDLNFVLQAEQLGTGHAVAQALPFLSADQVLILYGDVPLIQLDTLQRLLAQVTPDQLSLLTVDMLDPTGYGRIVRDDQGAVQATSSTRTRPRRSARSARSTPASSRCRASALPTGSAACPTTTPRASTT